MKLKQCSRLDLAQARTPVYTSGNYTIVNHLKALGVVEDTLDLHARYIKDEKLYLSKDGNLCYGQLLLDTNEGDKESDCLLTFLNSYDKSRAFNTRSALRIVESGNLIVLHNDSSGYRRVHKGAANEAIEENLSNSLRTIGDDFSTLVRMKNDMQNVYLSDSDIFALLGSIFFDAKILSSEQVNYIREMLDKPKRFTFGWERSSAFFVYLLCASSLEHRGNAIGSFVDGHRKLNEYFSQKLEEWKEEEPEEEYSEYDRQMDRLAHSLAMMA